MGIKQYPTKTAGKLWRLDIKVNGKVYTRRGFVTRQDALRAEAKLRDEIERGMNPRDQYQTLAIFLNYWVENLEKFRDEHTPQNGQQVRIKQHVSNINAVIGDIKIKDLKKQHVLELRDFYAEKHAARTRKQMEIILKAALNDGVAENFLPYNPIAQVKAPKIAKHQVKKVQALTPEQQIDLLSAAKAYSDKLNDPRWYMMISILIETGVRKGELCALQWKHIDFENRCIYVGQSIDWSYGETKGRIKSTKTEAGERTVYLDDQFCRQLKTYLTWVKEKCLQIGRPQSPDDFVLFADDFGAVNKSTPQSRWNTIAKKAGIENFGMHALRHTFASNMIHTGIKPVLLSSQLGHSKITTTYDIYGTLFEELAANEVREARSEWKSMRTTPRDNLL